MNQGPKERVVDGAIRLDWSKLDDILNDSLISSELDHVLTVLAEREREGLSNPEIEAAASLVRKFLESGERSAANNALFELRRLCDKANAPILKPIVKTGLKFRGRGKGRSELTKEIASVFEALGGCVSSKAVWDAIKRRRPELLTDVSGARFDKRVSAVRTKFRANR